VGLRHWPIIETEYSLNDTVQYERYLHRSGAASVKSAAVAINEKSNAEGFAEVCDRARQMHRSCSQVPAHSTQAMPTREPNYFLYVPLIRAVRGRKGFAREVLPLKGQLGSQFVERRQSFRRSTPSKNHGDLDTT
jgi:hypothetical protein